MKSIGFHAHFRQGFLPPKQADRQIRFVFQNRNLLVQQNDSGFIIPDKATIDLLNIHFDEAHYIGALDDAHCFALGLEREPDLPTGFEFHGLRKLFFHLPEDQFSVAGMAVQIIEWAQTHRYCGRCGSETQMLETERAKICPGCQLICFPRISPAVIVRITKGDEILLARSGKLPAKMYSLLAGFVEPGESLEETIEREVLEEANIRVKNIRYFGSQPWPFPHSLMIGFTADYAGGELRADENEIEHVDWFSIDDLPRIPGTFSIAGLLIEDFIELMKEKNE